MRSVTFYSKTLPMTIVVVFFMLIITCTSTLKKRTGNKNRVSTNNALTPKRDLIITGQKGYKYFDNNGKEIKPQVEYEVVYNLRDVRSDKNSYYLVLIEPVNTKDNRFKLNVKSVIYDLIKKSGKEISINIFDNKKALELYKNSNYLSSNQKYDIDNSNYYAFVAVHTIAQYTGVIFTNMYGENEGSQFSIDFYPAADKNVSAVASHIEHIDL